jgi:hypothetical protein
MYSLLPTAIEFAKNFGVGFLLAGIFAFIIYLLVISRVKEVVKKQRRKTVQIADLHKSVLDPTDPQNQRIIQQYEIREGVRDLREEIHELKKEISLRCSKEHCPILPVVTQQMDHMEHILIKFAEEGKNYREETKGYVKDIFERVNGFINEIGRELIFALRRKKDD